MFKRYQTTLNAIVARVVRPQAWLWESALVPVLAVPVVALTGQAAMAEKANFEVLNESSEDIVAIYITASYEGSWGESLLNEGSMPSGYGFQVEFNDPSEEICMYDIRAVFADGQAVEDYGVNVCYHDYYSLVD